MKGDQLWFVWDGRYRTDPDSAIVLDTCDSLCEAKRSARAFGDCVIEENIENEQGELKPARTEARDVKP